MKNIIKHFVFIGLTSLIACNNENQNNAEQSAASNTEEQSKLTGQSGVKDETSSPDVVKVAVGSKDHTTLVTAVKAAELVDALSNAGPFTVFALTNAAFDKLPKGTVEGLLKTDKKEDLKDILQYHVYVGVLKKEYLQDGQSFEQVNGGKIKITIKGDKVLINDTAEIIASVPASNGIVHVIDAVLLPKK